MTAGHFRAKHIVVNPLALSLALALAAPAVVAQTAPATTDQGPKTLDVITVTAEKREEDIQKVPISISTIPAEELDVLRLGGDDIRSLSARVPSLLIESSFGRTFPRFYIRGLGNTDFDLNASQPVSLVYDDVVLENPILKGFPAFDVDRIEVLRGPQGTLFGRNTPAGIVKFDTVKPGSGNNYAKISYGSYSTINAEAGVGGRLNDKVAVRISGLWQHRNDWIDNLDSPGSTISKAMTTLPSAPRSSSPRPTRSRFVLPASFAISTAMRA